MSDPRATYEDFILSFDSDEASELSNLNLPDDPEISRVKIEFQLKLAADEWLSWFGSVDYASSPVECTGSAIRCEIAIARYSMDYLNPREDVAARWQKCRDISRDYKRDQLDESRLPDGAVTSEPIMSIFTI